MGPAARVAGSNPGFSIELPSSPQTSHLIVYSPSFSFFFLFFLPELNVPLGLYCPGLYCPTDLLAHPASGTGLVQCSFRACLLPGRATHLTRPLMCHSLGSSGHTLGFRDVIAERRTALLALTHFLPI